MGIHYNAQAITDGLAVCVDAGNYKSSKGRLSLINWNSWTLGTGGVSGYGQNGNTAENQRIFDTDPWGYSSLVWGSYPSGDGNADGGWNTSWFNIDRTKLYRFSVWVRRTSSTTGGTFYLGMYDNAGSVRMDTGTIETNAYWDCRNISWMTQNQWYLVVGHVYPHTTTYTGRHPDTGVYTVENGRFGNIGGCNIGSGDIKWNPAATQGLHRTYHYYCGDSTSRLQFYQPRVDLCDGTEPKISELLSNIGNRFDDVVNSNNKFIMRNYTKYNTEGSLEFNGSSDFVSTESMSSFYMFSMSLGLYNYNNVPNNDSVIGGPSTYQSPINFNNTTTFGVNLGAWTGGATNEAVHIWSPSPSPYGMTYNREYVPIGWHDFTFNWNGTTYDIWIDGEKTTTYAHSNGHAKLINLSAIRIGGDIVGSYYFNGKIKYVKMYDRQLSDTEVIHNFTASRGRLGI